MFVKKLQSVSVGEFVSECCCQESELMKFLGSKSGNIFYQEKVGKGGKSSVRSTLVEDVSSKYPPYTTSLIFNKIFFEAIFKKI